MSTVTLSSGPITSADTLTVDLVTPADTPAAILIRWPGLGSPTVANPRRFPAVALAVVTIMDQAMIRLAEMIKAGEV